MPAKDHAAWDIGSATRRASQLREPSAEELRELAQARIAFVADALTAPDDVRAEYERRNPPGRAPSLRRLPWVLLGIAWIATLIGVGIGGYKAINLTTAVLIPSTLSSLVAARNWRRWFGPRERQRARRCPDCDFDLSASHAEPPLDVEHLGVELGPQHCRSAGPSGPSCRPRPIPGPEARLIDSPMPAKDHAAWDTLPERLHPRAANPEQPRAGREPVQLTAERVALVEAPPEPEALRAEYEARVRSWAPAETGRGVVLTLIGVTFVMALGLLALAATTSPLLAAPILLLWAPLGYLGWRRLNHRRTLTGRAASRCCPDCGFDLTGAPAGLDAEAFGLDVGPRRCPECGALWPLVPPPAMPDAEPRPYTRAMPPKDHAAWDLLPVLPKTTGDGTPRERAVRARTERYEQAAREAREATAALAAEHRRRLDAWALGGAFFGRGLTILFVGVPALFALLGVTAVAVKSSWPPRVQDLEVLLWSLAPTVIFLILARTFRTVLRPRRRLGARCCPDCGYDLRGARAGIDPAVLGVDVGPRWCPECGGFWPLVPPAPVHGA